MNEVNKTHTINDLVQIMDRLLAPGGCPWDREQTPKTLVPFAIEEAHELAEAIEKDDLAGIKEELGDLLLQVVFHCALVRNKGLFTLEDVIEGICSKLVRRHPHVFADDKVENSDEVLKNWNRIKGQEKSKLGPKPTFDVPLSLPALQRAQKIGDKTKNLKFDWENPAQVLDKVEEEMGELKDALKSGQKAHAEEELGDVFFVLAQLARHLKFEAESVARAGNRKFEKRFDKMMALVKSRGLDFAVLSTEEKESIWQEIKRS